MHQIFRKGWFYSIFTKDKISKTSSSSETGLDKKIWSRYAVKLQIIQKYAVEAEG